jgi:hypothetical protein
VSRFVVGLRALAGDSTPNAGAVGWPVLGPALTWTLGLAATVSGRTETWRLLLPQKMIQTTRLLMRWWRDPLTVIQSLVFPALLLIMLNTVVGCHISSFAGASALHGSVPMLFGLGFATLVTAVAVFSAKAALVEAVSLVGRRS